MNRQRSLMVLGAALSMSLVAETAAADAGVPMLVLIWPLFGLLFVPIVLIEGYFAARRLELGWKKALVGSLAANGVSTIAGVPVTWGLLFALQLGATGGRGFGLSSFGAKVLAVTLQAPWLIPYESDLYWMIPVAALVLLIPLFYMSIFVERWVMSKVTRVDRADSAKWAWTANLATYCLMALFVSIYGIRGAFHRE